LFQHWERNGVPRERIPLVRLLGLSLFLAAYGNVAASIVGTAVPIGWSGLVLAVVLLTVVLAWARFVDRLTPDELGLTRQHLLRGARLGLLVALGAAVPALLFLRFPPLVGQSIAYSPLASLSTEALLWRAFVSMPLDTAIPEEIAFRGVLLASLRRRLADRAAIFVSAAVFTAWHGVVVAGTIALTNLEAQPLLAALGLVGAVIAIGCGGVLFAWLRLTTGHLVGSVVAHWAFNASLLLGLGLVGSE
jgi:membrane protease YdiL (CAAX protease family)